MPVVSIDAPPGIRPEAKRKMVEKITNAIDEAYHIGDTLIFIREHQIDNVAMDGRIQSESPKIQEALKKIAADRLNGVFLNDTAGVQFTLYELDQELKRQGHAMKWPDLANLANISLPSVGR